MALSPGPQNVSKYPQVGPRYKKYGELTQQGWVYDPATDKYVKDPLGAEKQLQDEGLLDKPPEPAGLQDQLMGVGGTALALQLGKEGGEFLTGGDVLSTLKETATSIGDMFTGGGSSAIGSEALTQVGSAPMADGSAGILMSDGSVVPVEGGGSFLGPALSTLATLKGGYDTFNGFQNGGEGLRTGLTELGSGIGSFGGPITGLIGAGMGNVLGYGLQGDGIKNKLALAATAPMFLIPGVTDALMHKTTKQYQMERAGELKDSGFTDEQLAVLRPTLYGGEADNDEWKRLMRIEGNRERMEKSVTGNWASDGMLKAFGPEYLNSMSEQDRWALTKAAIDNNFLRDDKGDRVMSEADQEKLRAMAEDAKTNPAYISDYEAWVAAGKPKNGLNPLFTSEEEAKAGMTAPTTDPTSSGLLTPDVNVGVANSNAKGALVTSDPTKSGLLVSDGGVGGPGYRPDPNRPGHYVRV